MLNRSVAQRPQFTDCISNTSAHVSSHTRPVDILDGSGRPKQKQIPLTRTPQSPICRKNLISTAASVYTPIRLNQRNLPLLAGVHIAVLHP